jgi:hypothetical protein
MMCLLNFFLEHAGELRMERMDIVPLQTTLNTSHDQSPPGIQEEEKPKPQKTDQDQPQQPELAFLRC